VIRVRRALEILQVAGDTRSGGQIEIPTLVALIALQLCVPTCQRKAHRIVIEIRWLPSCGCMAFLTSLGKSERDVIRIVRLLKIGQVAAHARRWRSLVPPAYVARRAVEGGVHPRESKPGDFQVIELRAQPGVDAVTLLALYGKTRGYVIWLGRLLICALMAGITLDGKSLELSDRFTLVTVRALQSGMASHQGETVVVFPHPLYDDVPSFDCMALCAVRPHLTAMNVGMAVGTVRSGIRKHRLGMTLGTSHSLMQAAKRVVRLVMVELRECANRFPASGRMAVLARNIQVAMGAARNR
jgi:hypothetical protein